MKNSFIYTFLISFTLIFAMNAIATDYSYAGPTASPQSCQGGGCTNNTDGSTPSDNPLSPIDVTSTSQTKSNAGLSVSKLLVSDTGTITIDAVGDIGIGKTPAKDVRVDVTGSVKSSSLAGSGTAKLCTDSSNGSSTTGYPLVRC